jgi:uncharacterized membrane protein
VSDSPQTMSQRTTLRIREWIVAGVSLAVVLLFLLSPTSFALGKLDTIAYAVCHRIPERSFFLGGHQLPLCARCSGTFLGVLLTLITLTALGRSRASRLPPPRVLAVLASFFLLWALDGLNSFLTFYPGVPHLYEPQNWLRLSTGMLNGLALGTVVFSLLQFSLWHRPRPEPALHGWRELLLLVGLSALLVSLFISGNPALLYPLALASALGVVVMLTSTTTVVVLIATRRENSVRQWPDAWWPVGIGLAVSLVVIMGIGAGRAALTGAFDLRF